MIIDKLKRKGFKRSLSLFKEWFQEKYENKGRFYKFHVFLHEWKDEFQLLELTEFINETNNSFITFKMINENLYKGMINKKTLPTSFKNRVDAEVHCLMNEFRTLEFSLANSETDSPLDENQHVKNMKEKRAKNKERIQKEKEAREKAKEVLEEKTQRRRDKESFDGNIQTFNNTSENDSRKAIRDIDSEFGTSGYSNI